MKVVDTTGMLFWRVNQPGAVKRAASQVSADRTLDNALRKPHMRATTTMTPASSGYYAEGRANLKTQLQGFVDTRAFTEAYSSSLQSAKMTDQEIEALIARMNLTPR